MLGVLLLIALVIGLWALLAPRSFYDSFPGGNGMHWVSADGPYNRHLVSDVGSMYLALAALTVAALGRPASARLKRRRASGALLPPSPPSCKGCGSIRAIHKRRRPGGQGCRARQHRATIA